jgi:transglutaminase-like putative cysteine protease
VDAFLASSTYIDFEHPLVRAKALALALALALAQGCVDDVGVARACFEFVRDEIKHSWDFRCNPVTIRASEVLELGTGYCYAKSHLLAALLRANGLPAALCYQRLTITDVPPFCLHGLNAVYLRQFGWYRMDARGNKPGVDAVFDPPVERLAFALVHPGERDIEGLFAEPNPAVIRVLSECGSVREVFERLEETDVV